MMVYWKGVELHGSLSGVGDGCMEATLKILQQTMMDFSIFGFFALKNTMCEQLIICYNICMLYNFQMTHRINFKLCMSTCQWKVHCMIYIHIYIYKEWVVSSWVGEVAGWLIIAQLNLYGWSIIASLGGLSLMRTAIA